MIYQILIILFCAKLSCAQDGSIISSSSFNANVQPALGCSTVFCMTGTYCVMYNGVAECVRDRICALPKIVGPCVNFVPSFWYNSATDQCESFMYGGCQGSDNRFPSIIACQQLCRKAAADCNPPPPVSAPPPNCRYEGQQDAGGCIRRYELICRDVRQVCPPIPALVAPPAQCRYTSSKDANGCDVNYQLICPNSCDNIQCGMCETCIQNSNRDSRCILVQVNPTCCAGVQANCFPDPCSSQRSTCPQATFCLTDCNCVPYYYDSLWNRLNTQTQCQPLFGSMLFANGK